MTYYTFASSDRIEHDIFLASASQLDHFTTARISKVGSGWKRKFTAKLSLKIMVNYVYDNQSKQKKKRTLIIP